MTTKPGKGKGGLGRGFSAFGLSSASESAQGLMTLAIDSVEPNVNQPREIFKEEELNELAASIKEHGLLQPIVVSSMGLGQYRIIAGERRWRAARIAGLDEIPAVVKEVTPDQMLVLALVENIQRADLDPLEEARAYDALRTEYGLKQEEIAERVGKSRSAVANALRLLKLPAPAQDALRAGEVSEGHVKALQGLDDDLVLELALEQVKQHDLTVRQAEEMARMIKETGLTPAQARETILQRGAKPRRSGGREGGERSSRNIARRDDVDMITIDDQHVEDMIRRALTTDVKLIRRGRGGEIIIRFDSDEILQSIYELIVGPGSD